MTPPQKKKKKRPESCQITWPVADDKQNLGSLYDLYLQVDWKVFEDSYHRPIQRVDISELQAHRCRHEHPPRVHVCTHTHTYSHTHTHICSLTSSQHGKHMDVGMNIHCEHAHARVHTHLHTYSHTYIHTHTLIYAHSCPPNTAL